MGLASLSRMLLPAILLTGCPGKDMIDRRVLQARLRLLELSARRPAISGSMQGFHVELILVLRFDKAHRLV